MTQPVENNSDVKRDEALNPESLGIAGRMSRAFIHSPLSPLLFFAMLAMGVLGLIFTPRQEDPQISVPMVDIFVQYAGASSEQVASLAIDPLERIMSEIPGVKHVYSASSHGQGMVTIQFIVGEQLGPSIVKVHDKIQSNLDKMPPGVAMPLVKPKGIDDVPAVTLNLWSTSVDDGVLRTLALDLLQSLKQVPNTGQGFIVGGRTEQVRVEVLPERLSGHGISLDQVANTIRTANNELRAGSVESGDQHFTVNTGSFLQTADDIARLVVAINDDVPVYVRDVARVFQAPAETSQLVQFYTGPAYTGQDEAVGLPSVTVAISKKEGSNGVTVANAVITKVEDLKGRLIPDNVNIDITRNYGATANDKVNELIFKLFIATAIVGILVWFSLGIRPAIVVLFVIPVVILITVFMAWIMGYTIDRVSLFALIFSIGILVDDAIVVVENIYRRWLEKGEMDTDTAIDAVREVGNPTILATFTVIAALMPMGFVSGMMGPYMEPIPALGSVAMLFSLFAAFIFTPWLAMRIRPSMESLRKAEEKEHKSNEKLERMFRRLLMPIIGNRVLGWSTLGLIIAAFFLSCVMFYTTAVTVKMLPLDNKPEFSVVIDMPEGTALPVTANIANRIADKLRKVPEVISLQSYVGTAQPFDFNGMVRHYYLRSEPWHGEVHVNLLHKKERDRTSHEIAVEAREMLSSIVTEAGGRMTIVEMPPGPPVLQAVVAEIYGPDDKTRREVATRMTEIFDRVENVADVDNYMHEPYDIWRFKVDTEKAVRRGVSVDAINRNLSMAMGGYKLGDVKQGSVLEPTYIVLQVPFATRAQITRLGDLPVPTGDGNTIPLAELGQFYKTRQDPVIYHKDLRSVEYVVGEAVGRLAAPIYGMMDIQKELDDYVTPDGVTLSGEYLGPPADTGQSAFEWTGEWTVTYETFRDMGGAFGVALILIYILVVWEFGNFVVPAVIMAPIPLTLIGIIPGHWLLNAEFTATSMIGFIALAGIIVRNSILLVDFSIHQVNSGVDIKDAVVLACKTRTRPILITAFALVGGSSVIITDPIFQGMAISLLFGVMISTLLTLLVIPLGCISARAVFCPAAICENGSADLGSSPAVSEEPTTPLALKIWNIIVLLIIIIKTLVVELYRFLKGLFHAIRGLLARKQEDEFSSTLTTNSAARAATVYSTETNQKGGDVAPEPKVEPEEPAETASEEPAKAENAQSTAKSTVTRKKALKKKAVKKVVAKPVTTTMPAATFTAESKPQTEGIAPEPKTAKEKPAEPSETVAKPDSASQVVKRAVARKKVIKKKTVRKVAAKATTSNKATGNKAVIKKVAEKKEAAKQDVVAVKKRVVAAKKSVVGRKASAKASVSTKKAFDRASTIERTPAADRSKGSVTKKSNRRGIRLKPELGGTGKEE
jgi:multidrug efflux pump subunit AcrB